MGTPSAIDITIYKAHIINRGLLNGSAFDYQPRYIYFHDYYLARPWSTIYLQVSHIYAS